MNILKVIKNGIIDENPTFNQVLGMCPTLAVTTSAINGIGMGISTTVVLMMSNFFISVLRKYIPSKIRIPAFIIIIATFVSIISMLMKAFLPSLDKSLGIFIPLIVVNCIILARAESFASKNKPLLSVADGFGMGIGFTLALFLLGSIREVLGNGTIFDIRIFGESFKPAIMMILPPGAFLALGFLLAGVNKLNMLRRNSR